MKPTPEKTFRDSRVIAWGLAIAIAVLFTLSATSLAEVIETQPQYEDFCKPEMTSLNFDNKSACTENNGRWNEYSDPAPKTEPNGYCDTTYVCNADFQSARKIFGQGAFVTYIVLASIAIIVGVYLNKSFPVVTGLILGGIITSIVGAIKYFEYTPPLLRTILLVAICGLLVFIGIRKFQLTQK